MSRIRSFVGLAAAVLLVGTASLAQAQNAYIGILRGPADWSNVANWTPTSVAGGLTAASSTMVERQPSTADTSRTTPVSGSSISAAAARSRRHRRAGMDMST